MKPDRSQFDNHHDIPSVFFSAYSDERFRRCVDCDRELDEDVVYMVQKHFVGGEAVFEMALCIDCNLHLQQRLSEESKESILAFLQERASDVQRDETEQDSSAGHLDDGEDIEDWILEFPTPPDPKKFVDACAYCGTARDDCHRHAISGIFQGSQILVHEYAQYNLHWPLMVCENCVEQTNELISKQTRDEWDRFVEHNFDGPPGLEVDWPTQQPILM